jgi:hypothetical protein
MGLWKGLDIFRLQVPKIFFKSVHFFNFWEKIEITAGYFDLAETE